MSYGVNNIGSLEIINVRQRELGGLHQLFLVIVNGLLQCGMVQCIYKQENKC